MSAHLEVATHRPLRIFAHSYLSHFKERSSTVLSTVAGCGVIFTEKNFDNAAAHNAVYRNVDELL